MRWLRLCVLDKYHELVAPTPNLYWTELRMVERRPICIVRTLGKVLIAPVKRSHKVVLLLAFQIADVINLSNTSVCRNEAITRTPATNASRPQKVAYFGVRFHAIFSKHARGFEKMPQFLRQRMRVCACKQSFRQTLCATREAR